MTDIREQARERFAEVGFPTTKNEDWRFTNIAPIARTRFAPAPPASAVGLDREPTGYSVTLANGRFEPQLSNVPAGVQAVSLEKALSNGARNHFGRYAGIDNPFVALNTGSMTDGVYLHIPRGLVVDGPIEIVYLSAPGEEPAVSHPRALVVAEDASQVTLVERYVGLGDQVYFTNAVTEIVAGQDVVFDHYKVQLEQPQAYHVATLQVEQGRDGSFRSHSLGLGGALVRNDVNAVLSEGSECTLNGFYLGGGTQHFDNHTAIDHARPNATSHELYKGILDGRASAVFNGRILVRKDAQKTDAKQTNKNLVLSEDAVINTKPELQIFADDVRCTHGATIGQLDEEAIFYLQSRGIGRQDARDLLILAFARDITDRVKVEALRTELERRLIEKLHGNIGH